MSFPGPHNAEEVDLRLDLRSVGVQKTFSRTWEEAASGPGNPFTPFMALPLP